MSDKITNTSTAQSAGAEPGTGLSVYKPGQGYYTRMGTVVGVSLVTLLGVLWLWDYMKAVKVGSVNPLYVATAGSVLVAGVVVAILYYFVFIKRRTVDFLIATEGEMKKVNWSTRREIVGSTSAVIATTFIIASFCWLLDNGFFAFFAWIKVLDV
ncbi:MAG: hypothetical protein RIS86_2149 [Planctomycetota bacterium]|jgi:preprotein translocase SecE subunit